VSQKVKKNVVASVLARLRTQSRSEGAPFEQILQQYAMERFLFRISKSKHAQSVVLKGALLLKTIGIPNARPTLDIDMLRTGKADQASLLALIKDCATLEVQGDGVRFLAESAGAEEITRDAEYQGTCTHGRAHGQRAPQDSSRFRRGRRDGARPANHRIPSPIGRRQYRAAGLPGRENRQTPMPAKDILRGFCSGAPRAMECVREENRRGQTVDAFGGVIQDLRVFVRPAFGALAGGAKLTGQWKAGTGWDGS
jgi:Nucleotidyl transferase AbiEii toxin, Type IV TA system